MFPFLFALLLALQEPLPNRYGAVTTETIRGSGVVKLNGTTVTQSVHVNGSLFSYNAQIHELTVLGEANLTETVVHNTASIVGYLQTHKAEFEKPLTVTSQKAVCTASKFKGITFLRDAAFKGKQVLELKQGTLVDGPVTFESGKGEVVLYSGSQLLGPLTGGKIVRR